MANILDLLNIIENAIYGRDVRQAIIDAIRQCYEDGKAGVNDLQARTLIEAVMAVNEQQSAEIETLTARIEELESGGSGGSSETSTTSVPTFLVESGTATFENVGANKTATKTITFTENFTEVPTVLAIKVFRQGANTYYSQVTAQPIQNSITTTGFTLAIGNKHTQAVSPSVLWVAFQPTTVEVETEITTVDGMSEADVRALLAPITAALDALKIGYDGTEYDTAGASLREQINALHVLIGDEPGTAISASAVSYEDGNVDEALTAVNGRLTELESGSSGVPSDIRKALVTLAKAVTYKPDLVTDETGETPFDFSAEFTLLDAWASTRATAIVLSETSISFTGQGTKKLTATLTPADAEDTVRWSTTDSDVATVSANGTVTAVGNGTCTIVASVGSLTANCSVTVSGVVLMRSVTNNLTGCVNSSSAATVADGGSYTGTLTASSGYTMTGATVTVLMGGTDVTSTAYSNGTISIANVTGNIEITATGVLMLENGTYTFSNGHSVTVTDGNVVTGNVTSASGDMHANISSLSENTATANAYKNNYRSGTKKLFTIPAGATVRSVVTPLVKEVSASASNTKVLNIALAKYVPAGTEWNTATHRNGYILWECTYNDITVDTPVTYEFTNENEADIYTITMMLTKSGSNTVTFSAEIELYVNDIRII